MLRAISSTGGGGSSYTAGPNIDITGTTVSANVDGMTGGYTNVSSNISITSADANKNFLNTGASDYTVTPASGTGYFTLTRGSNDLSVPLPTENLVAQSDSLTNASWTATVMTVASGFTDPLGGSTAFKLTCNGVNSYLSGTTLLATPANNDVLCESVWVKGEGASIGKKMSIDVYNSNSRQYLTVTLTANWQQVSHPYATTDGLQPGMLLTLNNTATSANLANTDYIYVWRPQLNFGRTPLGYVGTTTTRVLRTFNYYGDNTTSATKPTIIVSEVAANVFVGSPKPDEKTGTDSSFLLIKSGGRRAETIVIAASDTKSPYASDYICSGSADQSIITAALDSLRGIGGKVKLRAGTFMLSDEIIMNSDHTTLEGECRGFWGKFYNKYPTKSSEGIVGGTKLRQNVTAKNILRIGTAYQQNDVRHKGLAIKNLYFYGFNLTGTGIIDPNTTDISEITDNVFHNLNNAIDVNWDTPFISGNTIQSCAGAGITFSRVYGTITKNIIYDIGGSGILLTSNGGTQIVGNQIGSVGATAIKVTSPCNTITGNVIQGVVTGHGIEVTTGTAAPTQNCITGNTISISNTIGATTTANTAGHGIYMYTGATGCTITGNNINNLTAGTVTGNAVQLGSSVADTTCNNNVVLGNAISGGKWSSAGATTIVDYGTGNKIGFNPGDSRTP